MACGSPPSSGMRYPADAAGADHGTPIGGNDRIANVCGADDLHGSGGFEPTQEERRGVMIARTDVDNGVAGRRDRDLASGERLRGAAEAGRDECQACWRELGCRGGAPRSQPRCQRGDRSDGGERREAGKTGRAGRLGKAGKAQGGGALSAIAKRVCEFPCRYPSDQRATSPRRPVPPSSTGSGTLCRVALSDGAGVVTTLATMACAVGPVNGGSPTSIS